jgi:hypothetical protein
MCCHKQKASSLQLGQEVGRDNHCLLIEFQAQLFGLPNTLNLIACVSFVRDRPERSVRVSLVCAPTLRAAQVRPGHFDRERDNRGGETLIHYYLKNEELVMERRHRQRTTAGPVLVDEVFCLFAPEASSVARMGGGVLCTASKI